MYTVNGKQYDYNSITNQRIKEKFVGNNVYANVTMMTDYILQKADYNYDPDAPFSYDDIENYWVSVCPNCGCSEEFDETAVCDIPIKPEPNPDFDPDREESDDNPKMLYPCPICGITYPDEESAYDCCSHIDYVYMCPECGEYTENLSDIDSKYQEIYERLRAKIINKKYKPNTYLPGEYELMEQYDASRDTIRKALNLLSLNGYIQKEKTDRPAC